MIDKEQTVQVLDRCESGLYYFDTEKVTAELNIEPTSVMIKKEALPKSTAWKYKIVAGSKMDLESYLQKLIDIFEPKSKIINQLKEKYHLTTRIQFVIDIDINPESSTPYFGLNKRVVDFLAKTGTEVDFDLYKSDTIGLLKKLDK